MTDKKESMSKDADIHALQKQWNETLCPICMDYPYNAVVLICTSYEKGCRPYICDTSYRHSNCPDRFRKLRMNSNENSSIFTSTILDNVGAERPHLSSPYSLDSASSPGDNMTMMNLAEPNDSYSAGEISDRTSAGLVECLDNIEDRQAQDRYLLLQVAANGSFNESESGNASEDNHLKCPLNLRV